MDDLNENQNAADALAKLLGDGHGGSASQQVKVKTFLPTIDGITGGGLAPGLHCVTGGPGSFKTALLLNVALRNALHPAPAYEEGGRYYINEVEYFTDEISPRECMLRLLSLMVADGAGGRAAPSWSTLEDELPDADPELSARVAEAARRLRDLELEKLQICDFGGLLPTGWTVMFDLNKKEQGYIPNRYLTSVLSDPINTALDKAIEEAGYDKTGWGSLYCDSGFDKTRLTVIDPATSLRTFKMKREWEDGEWWYYARDDEQAPLERIEAVVESLDGHARESGVACLATFHKHRGADGTPPRMADFKGSAAIEHRAVTAWELVRYSDMRWSGHPKPPLKPEFARACGFEQVGLFILKNRQGPLYGADGRPFVVPLACDGAHNRVWEIDVEAYREQEPEALNE